MKVEIIHGNCTKAMKALPKNSVDAIVTDPPYGLGFMGKEWDDVQQAWHLKWARRAFRVLKPGGHVLAFGGTRTFHRLTCALEDAGFEIRDCLMWLYGSGFPKSMDVSKAIDKAAGAVRETGPIDPERAGRLVHQKGDYTTDVGWSAGNRKITIDPPATDAAKRWAGWGTALKPAWEPIILARKPLIGTVVENVKEYRTGALNIDGCRVETGRWPANVILDKKAGRQLDKQTGIQKSGVAVQRNNDGDVHNGIYGARKKPKMDDVGYGDVGGASRFFYCAKASKSERGEGNTHPTVKPIALIRYLIKLVTPKGGVVLDPFLGSGTTVLAARMEKKRVIGIERQEEYVKIAKKRYRLWKQDGCPR